MHKFTFEALAPLIEELEQACKEAETHQCNFLTIDYDGWMLAEAVLDIIAPYKALVAERKQQIESLEEGSNSWAKG